MNTRAEQVIQNHRIIKEARQYLRPRCRGIDPDADEKGYYCRCCGYDLIETKTGWYRHGQEWRHPELWQQR